MVYRLYLKKLYNFDYFIAEKVNKTKNEDSSSQKHNSLRFNKIFKWNNSMVRCKSYGSFGNKW